MVYMNPPFQNPKPFILHYLECKEQRPYDTGCILVLPEWKTKKYRWCHEVLRGWQLLYQFPKFAPIFERPEVEEKGTENEGSIVANKCLVRCSSRDPMEVLTYSDKTFTYVHGER
jgi:hypothetical protein